MQHCKKTKNSLASWDVKNVKDTAFGEGMIEGEKKAKLEIAKTLKANRVGLDIIMQATGLTETDIANL